MKKEILKILKWSIISLFLGIATRFLLPIFIKVPTDIHSGLITKLFNIISVGVAIITTLIIIIIRFYKLINLQLDNKLHGIPNIVIKEARKFGNTTISKIAESFEALFYSNANITNILWEFKTLNLNNFEKDCINYEGELPHSGQPHKCNQVIQLVKKERRNRITRIANCLIFDKGEFFATETQLPSKIIDSDSDNKYYDDQKKFLQQHQIQNAYRFLIIEKTKLNTEITNNERKLKDFISQNTTPLFLRIITYSGDENINNVFSANTDMITDFQDFVLARGKKRDSNITVFAQNKNNLTIYDSAKDRHREDVNKYNNWVNFTLEKLKLDETERITSNVSYSGPITNINEIKYFNSKVQSKT